MADAEQVLIVGAGPIGLACGVSARRRGLDPLLIDAGAICESIVRYPVGMTFFTTPDRLEIGNHPLTCAGDKPTREEALMYYRGVARVEAMRVQTYTRLVRAARERDGIACELERTIGAPRPERLVVAKLVLATGYFDHPNLLDVPGEELPHVTHYAEEAHRLAGLDVVIVGAKNSAVELALHAFRAGARVTLVHRGPGLKETVKYWLRPDFENRVKAGAIAVRWNATVRAIGTEDVTIDHAGRSERLRADRVFLLTGFHPDFSLLREIGVELAPDSMRPTFDPNTLETNVPGVYLAGSLTAGRFISEVFIENGRFDGEKIFGDADARSRAERRVEQIFRPAGE